MVFRERGHVASPSVYDFSGHVDNFMFSLLSAACPVQWSRRQHKSFLSSTLRLMPDVVLVVRALKLSTVFFIAFISVSVPRLPVPRPRS